MGSGMPANLRYAAFLALRTAALCCLATLASLVGPARAAPLELAVDASPAGLDPHIITAFSSAVVVNGTVYEGLTAIDKDLAVVPGLAASWTTSPDGLSYS